MQWCLFYSLLGIKNIDNMPCAHHVHFTAPKNIKRDTYSEYTVYMSKELLLQPDTSQYISHVLLRKMLHLE